MIIKAKSNVNKQEYDEYLHHDLTPLKVYTVIEIEGDCFRIIDDSGEPYLYPKYLFTMVDPEIPEDWIKEEDDEGVFYIGPHEWSRAGFFEDYFDRDKDAIDLFRKVISRYYP